jgi:hypothetical protein
LCVFVCVCVCACVCVCEGVDQMPVGQVLFDQMTRYQCERGLRGFLVVNLIKLFFVSTSTPQANKLEPFFHRQAGPIFVGKARVYLNSFATVTCYTKAGSNLIFKFKSSRHLNLIKI